MRSRRGSGTFITDGPPVLGSEPLSFLAALHGFTRDEMYEVRRILEVGAAGLAAERAGEDHVATMADEIAGMFASIDDPQTFLSHDIRFHRAVGLASGNPIVASLAEMVSGLYYEHRRESAKNASGAGPAGSRGSPSPHLSRDPRARREAGARGDERAPAHGAGVPGGRTATAADDCAGLSSRVTAETVPAR